MIPDTLEISDTAALHLQDLYTKCGGLMFIAEMEEIEAAAGGLEKKKQKFQEMRLWFKLWASLHVCTFTFFTYILCVKC